MDSTNLGVIWDKFHIYQGHRQNTPFIQIGRKGRKPRQLKQKKHANALKQALQYRDLLESGQADSQAELARLVGIPRSTIAAYLRLLGIDEEVQAEALSIHDADERVARLTESRLRRLMALKKPVEQRRAFQALLADDEAQADSLIAAVVDRSREIPEVATKDPIKRE